MGDMADYFLSTEDYWDNWSEGRPAACSSDPSKSFPFLGGDEPKKQVKKVNICHEPSIGLYDCEYCDLGCDYEECDHCPPASEQCKQALAHLSAAKIKEKYSCPKCGAPMVRREGRYGKFYGCSTFPKCKGSRNL